MTHSVSLILRPARLAPALSLLALTIAAACSSGETESPPVGTGGMGGRTGSGGAPLGGGGGMSPEECFSPSRPDDAYAMNSVGCACDGYADQSVCVGAAALICEENVWIAVEDGPCARADACAGVANTWQSCLADFDTCSESSDGTFCGRDPIQERPVCPTGHDWAEFCSYFTGGIGTQIVEGCGYVWIRANYADSTRNTIVDAQGIVVFQQWNDPLSTINPGGCRGGTIPECEELSHEVLGNWNDIPIIKRGDECWEQGMGGAGGSGVE